MCSFRILNFLTAVAAKTLTIPTQLTIFTFVGFADTHILNLRFHPILLLKR